MPTTDTNMQRINSREQAKCCDATCRANHMHDARIICIATSVTEIVPSHTASSVALSQFLHARHYHAPMLDCKQWVNAHSPLWRASRPCTGAGKHPLRTDCPSACAWEKHPLQARPRCVHCNPRIICPTANGELCAVLAVTCVNIQHDRQDMIASGKRYSTISTVCCQR